MNKTEKGAWYKGYLHYHTSFNYPAGKRIIPERLLREMRKTGASFVLCAGDHGDANGDNYWGWYGEFKDYRKLCLSKSKNGVFLFVPALEIHLNFPPFSSRQEHHSCVPTLNYLPPLKPAEEKALAVSYTTKVKEFIEDAHKHNISLTLNHPYFSCHSPFNAPSPLSVPALYRMDYFELFTSGTGNFRSDFSTYLKFLQHPVSGKMGICAGIDNATRVSVAPLSEPKLKDATYVYVTGRLDHKNLIDAWNNRSTYAVSGGLYLKGINPLPGKKIVRTATVPAIELEVENSGNKKIETVAIYRQGKSVYRKRVNRETFSLAWEDKDISGTPSYIIHVKAEDGHLITSPIHFRIKT